MFTANRRDHRQQQYGYQGRGLRLLDRTRINGELGLALWNILQLHRHI
jgi:hypothetical protein